MVAVWAKFDRGRSSGIPKWISAAWVLEPCGALCTHLWLGWSLFVEPCPHVWVVGGAVLLRCVAGAVLWTRCWPVEYFVFAGGRSEWCTLDMWLIFSASNLSLEARLCFFGKMHWVVNGAVLVNFPAQSERPCQRRFGAGAAFCKHFVASALWKTCGADFVVRAGLCGCPLIDVVARQRFVNLEGQLSWQAQQPEVQIVADLSFSEPGSANMSSHTFACVCALSDSLSLFALACALVVLVLPCVCARMRFARICVLLCDVFPHVCCHARALMCSNFC